MTDLRAETNAAITLVEHALGIAGGGPGEIHAKSANDLVTDADLTIEDQLRQSLQSAFPWPVIGEERGGVPPESGTYWVLDPICGTRNFASNIPLFAINIALIEDGRITIAVVGDGSTGNILFAEIGGEAWRRSGEHRQQISTSGRSHIVDFEAWPREELQRDRAASATAAAIAAQRWEIRTFSTTLALPYVATGQIAGCVMFSVPDLVHIAPGTLLIAEAGGSATDARGQPWALGSESFVGSADRNLHRELLEFLDIYW